MDQQLIEQLACYLGDRIVPRDTTEQYISKDELAGNIADFFTEGGIPHKDALVNLLVQYKPPIERPDDFIPYDWFGGNMDDAYNGGVEDGERQLAAEIRDLLGIEL